MKGSKKALLGIAAMAAGGVMILASAAMAAQPADPPRTPPASCAR